MQAKLQCGSKWSEIFIKQPYSRPTPCQLPSTRPRSPHSRTALQRGGYGPHRKAEGGEVRMLARLGQDGGCSPSLPSSTPMLEGRPLRPHGAAALDPHVSGGPVCVPRAPLSPLHPCA